MICVMNNPTYKLLTEIIQSLVFNQTGTVILKASSPHAQALLTIHKAECARRDKLKKV